MASDADIVRCAAPWPGTTARLLEQFFGSLLPHRLGFDFSLSPFGDLVRPFYCAGAVARAERRLADNPRRSQRRRSARRAEEPAIESQARATKDGWPRARRMACLAKATFLRNHADGIVAIDMFVVPTVSFRLLYGLLILQHARRELLWLGVTAHPSA
jgi:hypothetical protein